MVGAICGAGMIHAINTTLYDKTNGGCNFVQPGYSNGKCGGTCFELSYAVLLSYDVAFISYVASDASKPGLDLLITFKIRKSRAYTKLHHCLGLFNTLVLKLSMSTRGPPFSMEGVFDRCRFEQELYSCRTRVTSLR
jgi:hypothetical protein